MQLLAVLTMEYAYYAFYDGSNHHYAVYILVRHFVPAIVRGFLYFYVGPYVHNINYEYREPILEIAVPEKFSVVYGT